MKPNKAIFLIIVTIAISSILVWKSIKQGNTKLLKETFIVGTNSEYPPYTFIKDKKIIGFDIDLINEIAKKLKITVEIKDMPWSLLLNALETEQIDIIAAGLTPTEEKIDHAIFTKPYIKSDKIVLLNLAKNNPIKNLEQLSGKKVTINDGYSIENYIPKLKGAIIKRVKSPAQGFIDLIDEKTDAFIVAESVSKYFFDKYGTKEFNSFPLQDISENYCLAVSKKHPELLEKIQKALDELIQDETINKLIEKYKIPAN